MKVQLEVPGAIPFRAHVDLPCIPRVGDPVRYGGAERSVRHVLWTTDAEPWVRLILNPNDDDTEDDNERV